MHEEDLYTDRHKVDLAVWLSAGPDLGEGANWAVVQGPPQLRASTKTVKKYLLPKETQKYFLQSIKVNIDILSYCYNCTRKCV